jgi:hypothetical protein
MKTRNTIKTVIVAMLIPLAPCANAAKFTRAEVTKAVNDVKLLIGSSASKPAKPGSVVSGSTSVLTGQKSRAELQFPDESLVRLGSNSAFSFESGNRDVDLKKGTLLMQVPKSLGDTKIKTAAVTAAITGTTIMFEYIPPVLDKNGKVKTPGSVKIIVIEGSLEFGLNSNPKEKMELLPGEMVAFRTDAKSLPKKFNVDLQRLVRTSQLVDAGMGPLPDRPIVRREVITQNRKKGDKQLTKAAPPKRRLFGRPQGQGGGPTRGIRIARSVENNRPPAPTVARPTRPQQPNTGNGAGSRPPATTPIVLPDRPDRNTPSGGGTAGTGQ